MLRRQAAKPQVRLGEGSKVINTLRRAATWLSAFFVYRPHDAEGFLQVSAGFCRSMVQNTSPPKSEETQGVWSLFAGKKGFLHFLHHVVRVFLRNRDHPVD